MERMKSRTRYRQRATAPRPVRRRQTPVRRPVVDPDTIEVRLVMHRSAGMGAAARERQPELLFLMRALYRGGLLGTPEIEPTAEVHLADGRRVFFDPAGDDMGHHPGHDVPLIFTGREG